MNESSERQAADESAGSPGGPSGPALPSEHATRGGEATAAKPGPQSEPRPGGNRAPRQLAIFGTEILPWVMQAARTEPTFPAQLQQRLARDRRFGSRDRRTYRELAYATVRFLPRIERAPEAMRAALALQVAAGTPEILALRAACAESGAEATDGSSRNPAGPDADLFPDWFASECPALAHDAAARAVLNTRAPLWLRAQRASVARLEHFLAAQSLAFRTSSAVPGAIAVLRETDLTTTPDYERGDFEIQDLGSQLLLHLAAPVAGSRWLDACAGAGGKSLQLAQLVGPRGHVTATDIRRGALEELRERARRAGLANITIKHPPLDPAARFDGVLVDAPCSGSGTWRRAPHLKWQTTRADLAAQAERQFVILSAQSAHVAPGGQLVYATCSLARTENEEVVARFLAAHPEFSFLPPAETRGAALGEFGLTVLPHAHDSDGFFAAVMRRAKRDA